MFNRIRVKPSDLLSILQTIKKLFPNDNTFDFQVNNCLEGFIERFPADKRKTDFILKVLNSLIGTSIESLDVVSKDAISSIIFHLAQNDKPEPDKEAVHLANAVYSGIPPSLLKRLSSSGVKKEFILKRIKDLKPLASSELGERVVELMSRMPTKIRIIQ